MSHSLAQGSVLGRQTSPAVPVPVTPLIPASRHVSASGVKSMATPPSSELKKSMQTFAADSSLSKELSSQSSRSKSKKPLGDQDFPSLNPLKPAGSPQLSTIAPKTGASLTKSVATGKKSAEKQSNRPAEKSVAESSGSVNSKAEARVNSVKPIPGVLNIAAATKASQATTDKPSEKDSAFPALPTPTATSASSPLARNAPKTLRVMPASKPDALPPIAGGVASGPLVTGPPIRSAASIRPETPVSEMISDSASIISASFSASRTNSPPPTRVGAAPVRPTTKSQQRKARKEALKKEAAEAALQAKQEAETEIGPIVGRKKKQKKERSGTATATPAQSRPQTPVPNLPLSSPVKDPKPVKETRSAKDIKPTKDAKPTQDTKSAKGESSAYRSTAHETTTLIEEKPAQRVKPADAKRKGIKAKQTVSSEELPPDASTFTATTANTLPTPASTWRELDDSGVFLGPADNLAFVKPVAGVNDRYRHDPAPSIPALRDFPDKDTAAPIPTKSIVTEEDQATLLSGKPVRKIIDGVRILLTPNGDCVRHLTEEEEDRFLELQERVAESAASPAAFVSSRYEPAGGFSLVKGRAVPNGPPGYFPQAAGAYPSDPVSKIQREEAIYYINQYVLPRLNLGTINLEFPGSWKSTFPDGKANVPATVPNLNSFAPWIYRNGPGSLPDDTAPPELSYPAPAGGPGSASTHSGLASVLELTANGVLGVGPDAASPVNGPSSSAKSGPTMAPSPFGSVPLMSLEDAEQGLAAARKETEKMEKNLNQLIKRNRRLFISSSGSH